VANKKWNLSCEIIYIFTRSYAVRKIKDSFKANKALDDVTAINAAYDEALTSLEILKRQVSEYYWPVDLVNICDLLCTVKY